MCNIWNTVSTDIQYLKVSLYNWWYLQFLEGFFKELKISSHIWRYRQIFEDLYLQICEDVFKRRSIYNKVFLSNPSRSQSLLAECSIRLYGVLHVHARTTFIKISSWNVKEHNKMTSLVGSESFTSLIPSFDDLVTREHIYNIVFINITFSLHLIQVPLAHFMP